MAAGYAALDFVSSVRYFLSDFGIIVVYFSCSFLQLVTS